MAKLSPEQQRWLKTFEKKILMQKAGKRPTSVIRSSAMEDITFIAGQGKTDLAEAATKFLNVIIGKDVYEKLPS